MERHEHTLKSGCLGTRRTVSSFHFGAPDSGGKAYIQASLHADELPGMLVAWYLKRELNRLEAEGCVTGEIIVVPQANPIGHAQALLGTPLGRFELASGNNFNRHYPRLSDAVYARVKERLGADAAGNTRLIRAAIRSELALREDESELDSQRTILMSLAADADIVLDLHCDLHAALHVYTGTPLWEQCAPLARLLGSSAQLLATESGDEPFDEACSQTWWHIRDRCLADGLEVPIDMACLAVTVELRGQRQVSHALASRDAAAILDFLRLRGLIHSAAAPLLPELRFPATPLAGSENLKAPFPGLVCFHVEPGDVVTVGQPVADIIDPLDDTVVTLSSAYGGMVYAVSNHPYAMAGASVAKVATNSVIKSGKLLSA
ncbi:succinylglutamate desuccinylase/aspartoacylase family protein [Paludibacterium yongneupense]|uniref:succinylglutamate desuccinylase/aspartoacylase family protein n=1 Tax=Paludibacterium yongneupense TaxID=400061 RepID=UPI00042166DC|nr:succinylglutamate desuccinylase/aspartoacylase family protein [Paludibacterium yongneupense]